MRRNRAIIIIVALVAAVAGYYMYSHDNSQDRNKPGDGLTEKDQQTRPKLKSKSYVNIDLTAAELAAYRAEIGSDTIPLTNVKFNTSADGTTVITGVINADRLKSLLSEKGASADESDKLIRIITVSQNVQAYIKGKFEIKDNQASIDVQQLEIDGMPIPGFLYRNKMAKFEEYIEETLKQKNYKITSLTFVGDKVHYEGYVP